MFVGLVIEQIDLFRVANELLMNEVVSSHYLSASIGWSILILFRVLLWLSIFVASCTRSKNHLADLLCTIFSFLKLSQSHDRQARYMPGLAL